jgi:hypothetical protein
MELEIVGRFPGFEGFWNRSTGVDRDWAPNQSSTYQYCIVPFSNISLFYNGKEVATESKLCIGSRKAQQNLWICLCKKSIFESFFERVDWDVTHLFLMARFWLPPIQQPTQVSSIANCNGTFLRIKALSHPFHWLMTLTRNCPSTNINWKERIAEDIIFHKEICLGI